jgi:hypothetical protein
LKIKNETRFDSIFKMIEAIIENKEAIDSLTKKNKSDVLLDN